ncbi:hypothetical protein MD484_g5406, partial [Candolleomyces efflorescens]
MDSSIEEKKVEGPDMLKKSDSLQSSSSAKYETEGIDLVAERRLVRKLDWMLMPLFIAIYICNFIDRTSIGLEADLGLKGLDFNIAVTVFYVFYIVSDIPSNLLLKQWGSIWLAFLVIGFGVVSIASAFLHNMSGLLASRVFLGLFEGGTVPGLMYILSRYYRKHELAVRIGIFFGGAPSIAGACEITFPLINRDS